VSTLHVYLHDRLVGALTRPDEQLLDFTFTYYRDYLAAADSDDDRDDVAGTARPISLSLALRAEPYAGAVARNWFANLLPEGAARQHLAAQFGLTVQDDFGLLGAIGRECAGAVSLWPQDQQPQQQRGARRPLDDATIEAWVQSRPRGAISGDGPLRLSLAGAQDKIGVVLEQDGSLSEPVDGAISSHILKAPNADYPGLISLEALGMRLARAAQLHVPAITLVSSPTNCLLVNRFDRERLPNGAVRRLHQEDFCQALGLPPEHKYEVHGGPSLPKCFALVRDLGLGATALNALLDWTILNVALGNADAHGKNLALLYKREGTTTLAPFYDMVPTAVLPVTQVDRDLAMTIGRADNVDDIKMQDWRDLAKDCSLAARYVTQRVASVVERARNALDPVANELISQGAEQPIIEHAVKVIGARCEALLSGTALPRPDIDKAPTGAWGMSL
jgi:serine/threonine-protein kinase HipA